MKRKLKDYDDVLWCCRKDIVKYDRASHKDYDGFRIGFRRSLKKGWWDPGSTRDGWNFFRAWFDSNVGRDARDVRRDFATCKKWNEHWRINQKWNYFVDDTWTVGNRSEYYIDDNGLLQQYV